MAAVVAQLQAARPGLRVVATGDATPEALRASPGPGNNRLAHKAFLDRHTPGAVLLTGSLDQPLAAYIDKQGLPAIWTDAVVTSARRWTFLNRAGGDTVPRAVRRILAADADAAEKLKRDRDLAARVEAPGPFSTVPQPLPYSVSDRDDLARLLSGRPVWLCATPAPGEFPAMLEAHRIASGLSHRLLLIAAVAPEDAEGLARKAQAEDWHIARRSRGDEPAPEVQVFICDDPDELGLWYRLAAITFLGSTLVGPGAPRHPFEPATLGSAVLHGPRMGEHATDILRLARAGAARRVDSGETLGSAVARLLSPDAAAEMAAAGWDVVTAGAPAMNRTVALVEDLLDGVLP